MKRLMTTGEAAHCLSVSSETVRAWAFRGKLRVLRTEGGRYRLFDADEIKKLAAERIRHRRIAKEQRKRGRS